MSFVRETTVKAVRKQHRCEACRTHIEIGQPATRWSGMTDGDFGSAIFHLDCRKAEVAYNRLHTLYDDEWIRLADDWGDAIDWLREEYPTVAARFEPALKQEAADA